MYGSTMASSWWLWVIWVSATTGRIISGRRADLHYPLVGENLTIEYISNLGWTVPLRPQIGNHWKGILLVLPHVAWDCQGRKVKRSALAMSHWVDWRHTQLAVLYGLWRLWRLWRLWAMGTAKPQGQHIALMGSVKARITAVDVSND